MLLRIRRAGVIVCEPADQPQNHDQDPTPLLQVGTNEMLRDDARRLALRASDAEVDVILDVTAKVPHVFQAFTAALDEAGEALDRAALFLRQHVRS